MNFGRRVYDARRRLGLTQAKLGALLKVDKSEISHYEQGRRIPRMPKLLLLANILGTNIAELFAGEEVECEGLKWGCIEVPQDIVYIPHYSLLECGVLEFINSVPTEGKNLQKGLYQWISVEKLDVERLIINQKVRLLMKYETKEIGSNDIVLLRKEGNYKLGELSIVSEVRRDQHLTEGPHTEILGKISQIVLDL